MDITPSQRMSTWREEKRRAGYRSLTVYLKASVKHLLEDLAAQRREDPAQTVTAAIEALAEGARLPENPKHPDYLLIQQIVAEQLRMLLPDLAPSLLPQSLALSLDADPVPGRQAPVRPRRRAARASY